MNDMSRIWRIPTPPPDRPLVEAMVRGFVGRCPSCGRGRLFRSYLKVVGACDHEVWAKAEKGAIDPVDVRTYHWPRSSGAARNCASPIT